MNKKCPTCKKMFLIKHNRKKYCSRKCSSVVAVQLSHKNHRMKNGQARRMGLESRKYENSVADTLKYKSMFLPNEVCDRIVIKNGKIIFIEIKHPGQELRPKQEQFKNLVGSAYKIIYGK